MSFLTSSEHDAAKTDVAAMIAASGLEASLWRRDASESGRYGEEDSAYADLGVTFPFEWHPRPKETLTSDSHDAEIHVLPDLDIREEDRVIWNGQTFKVLNVVPENLFGATTHQLVRLARVHDAS